MTEQDVIEQVQQIFTHLPAKERVKFGDVVAFQPHRCTIAGEEYKHYIHNMGYISDHQARELYKSFERVYSEIAQDVITHSVYKGLADKLRPFASTSAHLLTSSAILGAAAYLSGASPLQAGKQALTGAVGEAMRKAAHEREEAESQGTDKAV